MPTADAQGELPAECVINISEGRDQGLIRAVAEAGGDTLLDLHSDGEHHRSVLTLAGDLPELEASARRVARAALDAIDLRSHRGVHPRLGSVDVVPFVPLRGPVDWDAAVGARDRFARWIAGEGVPCFLYGTGRSLPEVRRGAFTEFPPNAGPRQPHRSAGACAVGVRDVLIAYNVWIRADRASVGPADDPVAVAKVLAKALRRPGLRTLGLPISGGAQVSCNVVDVERVSLADVYDAVSEGARPYGCAVWRGELVGLLPGTALAAVPERRRPDLGLRVEDTIEYRRHDRTG